MISIIIPAYNEEKRIIDSLKKITLYMEGKGEDYELILVDDGSEDKTIEIASKTKGIKIIKNGKNKGKGYSVKRGVLESKGDFILFSDADLSTPIEELDKFISYTKEYDIIIGSRNLKNSNLTIRQPFLRELFGKAFALLTNLFIIKNIKDTQCGFKLFKAQTAKSIFSLQRIDGFGFDIEILHIALKKGLKIKEVPITWTNSADSKLNLVKEPGRMFLEMIQIKINDLRSKYQI